MLARTKSQDLIEFSTIDLQLNEETVTNPDGSSFVHYKFSDSNDQSMKTIIKDFVIGDIDRPANWTLKYGNQLVFFYHDTSLINLNIITNCSLDKCTLNKDYLLVACATESILKILCSEGLMQSKSVIFQARVGNPFSAGFKILSGGFEINETPKADLIMDVVKSTYALLQDRQIIIFFKNETTPEQTKKIESILEKHFNKHIEDSNLICSMKLKTIT